MHFDARSGQADGSSVKALYRRAQALTSSEQSGVVELDAALRDLSRARSLEPTNALVARALEELSRDVRRQREVDRRTFGGLFSRGHVYEDVPTGDADGPAGPTPNRDAEASARVEPGLSTVSTSSLPSGVEGAPEGEGWAEVHRRLEGA